MTKRGRVGFFVKPSEGITTAYIQTETTKKQYTDPVEFVADITRLTGLRAPEALLTQLDG